MANKVRRRWYHWPFRSGVLIPDYTLFFFKWTKTITNYKYDINAYRLIIPVPYGSICCTYHQPKYSSPNHSNKTMKSHTKKPNFQKMEEYLLLQKNTIGDTIEQWDQTDSPKIPDSGETSEIPRPPFGGVTTVTPQWDRHSTITRSIKVWENHTALRCEKITHSTKVWENHTTH